MKKPVVHYWPRQRPNRSFCGTGVNRPYTARRSEVTCKTCIKAAKLEEECRAERDERNE